MYFFKVAPGMCLGRIFIMPGHFAIFKNAKMILPFESIEFPHAHELTFVAPRDEMVAESLRLQICDERGNFFGARDFSEHEMLPTVMMEDAQLDERVADAEKIWRDAAPEQIFYLPPRIRRIRDHGAWNVGI